MEPESAASCAQRITRGRQPFAPADVRDDLFPLRDGSLALQDPAGRFQRGIGLLFEIPIAMARIENILVLAKGRSFWFIKLLLGKEGRYRGPP